MLTISAAASNRESAASSSGHRLRWLSEDELSRHPRRNRFAADGVPLEHRAILLDPEEARRILDKNRRKWRSRIRGFKDQVLKTKMARSIYTRKLMAEDAEQAMGVAASGDVQFAQYTSNIICLDENLDRLGENSGRS